MWTERAPDAGTGIVGSDAATELLTGPLRTELAVLLARCRQREALAEGLGIAATTRYRTGVRALFVGPSGTGKTLAAGWLATHLGLPLYRVDMASVISKYIGETEKNLAELLARNAVLAAAVLAREAGRPLAWEDVVQGVALECRKLGRPLPAGLERR